jgi:hypothetical protein
MKYLILIITLLCFTCTSNAQHCEWDNSALIAVRPLYNGKFVDDLQIELISTDNPYSTKVETHKNGLYTIYKDGTKKFAKQNDIDRIKNLAAFKFIKNDYALITSSHFKEGIFIKITDVSKKHPSQKIATQIIPVTKEHLLALCSNRSVVEKYDSLYHPIVVLLHSDTLMQSYRNEVLTNIKMASTFYTPPVLYQNESVIFQIIQTGNLNQNKTSTIEHEFFKIHPYSFAMKHFDSLKNIYLNEQGFVLDSPPRKKSSNNAVLNTEPVKTKDTLPQPILPKKVAESYDETPSLKAFIAYKIANGNEGIEKYLLKINVEKLESTYLFEYLSTYKNINQAKLEFDLDSDRDMDYCIVYRKPEPHIDYFIFDNILRQFVVDTLMSKAPYLSLNLKENKLVTADYSMPQPYNQNRIHTYKRWNNEWKLIEYQLQDYQMPHNNNNEERRRLLNDVFCNYNANTREYIQFADYNFDGRLDTRIAHDSNVVFHNAGYYCEKFDYYIYNIEKGKSTKDELLSSGIFTFDFNKKTAVGYVENRNYTKQRIWSSVRYKYEWIEHKFIKTEKVEQIQACPNCEKIITITSKFIDGKWEQVDYNPGAE